VKYFCDGMGSIQEEWERQGRAPLLDVPPIDQERGRQCLARMGLPEGAWFVCLHVRSPGFHREQHTSHQAHRNADVRTYLPAVAEVVARGGWVVRLGDPSMEPLGGVPGLIDYPHSPFKSDWMDVFLIAGCRFFVGVASGLCNIPTTFGVPCVLTNWVSNHLPVYSGRDLFTPKLCWSDAGRRFLSFDEFFTPSVRLLSYSNDDLSRRGLRVVDNTSEEIRDVVVEMFEVLDGAEQDTGEDRALQAAFRAAAARHGLAGFSRIGRAFLRKYSHLVEPAPEAATSPQRRCA
jgi:putative glycosyltransferase (TIGR04372 family)